MSDISLLLEPLKALHATIRDAVVTACEQSPSENMSAVAAEEAGDTIYAIDRISEELIIDILERDIAPHTPVLLVAEGIEGGRIMLPKGTPESEAVWQIMIDPIDGTRGIMYQKRSAWILTGVAPNKGNATSLQDIELAIQTEIPLVKQHLSDMIWAQPGKGVQAVRYNRLTGEETPLALHPSRADNLAHGYFSISKFFPGTRDLLGEIDEEITHAILGPVVPGKALCFEDQYICSGGQFYELMAGRDRFICDLRPIMEKALTAKGLAMGICCHPYDVCTELIARELGVIITDVTGAPLDAPFDIHADVAWAGYANQTIRDLVEPHLLNALRSRGLLDE